MSDTQPLTYYQGYKHLCDSYWARTPKKPSTSSCVSNRQVVHTDKNKYSFIYSVWNMVITTVWDIPNWENLHHNAGRDNIYCSPAMQWSASQKSNILVCGTSGLRPSIARRSYIGFVWMHCCFIITHIDQSAILFWWHCTDTNRRELSTHYMYVVINTRQMLNM